jgi:hypothetical protein
VTVRPAPDDSAPPPGRPPVTPAQLALIRIALLTGVLTFGAVTWFLHRGGGWTPADPARVRVLLRTPGLILWALVIAAVAFLRVRWSRLADDSARAATSIIAWAAAESVALFGAAYYLLSGDPRWYTAGLFLLLVSFMLFRSR